MQYKALKQSREGTRLRMCSGTIRTLLREFLLPIQKEPVAQGPPHPYIIGTNRVIGFRGYGMEIHIEKNMEKAMQTGII